MGKFKYVSNLSKQNNGFHFSYTFLLSMQNRILLLLSSIQCIKFFYQRENQNILKPISPCVSQTISIFTCDLHSQAIEVAHLFALNLCNSLTL